MALIGYCRVSTDDQSSELQRDQLTRAGCQRIFEERVSGKSVVGREELHAAIKFVVPGDVLVVTKLDRLGRNTVDMLTLISDLGKRGIKFASLAEPWANTDSPAAELILTLMVGVATFERGRIRERQLEGIAKAKAAGKYRGRKPSPITIEAINALKAKGLPMSKIATELKCGRASLYRALERET